MTKFFKKFTQKTILGTFWGLFAQIWEKMNCPGKGALSVFKYSNY